MAIDTKSLSQLISEFRKLQTKDSVTPESLGYILQRIADLLATAGTSDTVEKLQKLLDGFKTAGSAITSLVQGKTDRNHVYANIGKVSLTDGTTSTSSDVLFIQQATTDRAGAMRAQQVTDLNAVRKNVTELQKQMEAANNLIDTICVKLGLNGSNGIIGNSQISCISPKDTPTEAQCLALIKLLRELKASYPSATIHGHNEFANKACPSFIVKNDPELCEIM